jgi:hypothetical protein
MIDTLFALGLLASVVVGYFAWKNEWKIADIF